MDTYGVDQQYTIFE